MDAGTKERFVAVIVGATGFALVAPVAKWAWTEGLASTPDWAIGLIMMLALVTAIAMFFCILLMGYGVFDGPSQYTKDPESEMCVKCGGTVDPGSQS